MRKRHVFSILLLTVIVSLCLLGGTSPWAVAQKLRMTQGLIATKVDSPEHEGLVIPYEGETISKKGVVFKFQGQRDSEKRLSGYRYEASNLDSLRKGDKLRLFIRGINITEYWGQQRGEFAGTLELTGVSGGWKDVTIESVSHEGDTVVIGFQKPLKLQSGKELQSLRFTLREGYLEEALPAAAPK